MKTAFVTALFIAMTAFACHRDATPTSTTTITAKPMAASAPIYPLQLSLRDEGDQKINVDVFRGHPVIISMFYGTCPAACPMLVSHIKQIESSLTPAARADVRVLLVSFDADRDTPEALQNIASAHHVDRARWRLAAGVDDDARQLANVLGIEYRKGEDGFFSHNSVISVLDREGRIVARSDDPSADLKPLTDATQALAGL